MAKILSIFPGDMWINSAGKEIRVVEVLKDGHIMVTSNEYGGKIYKLETRPTIYNINENVYKSYITDVPDAFIVRATNTHQRGRTKYDLLRSLDAHMYDQKYMNMFAYDSFALYSNGNLREIPSSTARIKVKNKEAVLLGYEKFVSVYNTLKLINFKDQKNGKNNQEIRREERNTCAEIHQETIDLTKSRGSNERKIGLSSQVRKIRFEESKAGGKIGFKNQKGRIKIPNIQFRLFDHSVCGHKGGN